MKARPRTTAVNTSDITQTSAEQSVVCNLASLLCPATTTSTAPFLYNPEKIQTLLIKLRARVQINKETTQKMLLITRPKEHFSSLASNAKMRSRKVSH